MSTRNYAAILKKCEELTQNGETLSVTWDGGGDSGWFELKLDDQFIENDYGKEDSIIDLIDGELEYGGFTGHFSTTGEVVYNNEEKCFEGTDTYSESASDSTKCEIKIHIPDDLWFDRLELRIETTYTEVDASSAQLIVLNGPLIDAHRALESTISQTFAEQIIEHISEIDNLESVNEQFTFSRSDFTKMENDLVCTIEKFTYGFNDCTEKNIHISLTE